MHRPADWTPRQTVQAGMALGALSAIGGRLDPAEGPDPFQGWKVAVAMWSLRKFPLEAQMAITRGLGL